jgi:hypothetical protein
MTRDEVIELTREHAREAGIPERVGLALIWAESNFDPNATRHTSNEDYSVGLGQQTFRWSEFWQGSYQDHDAINRWMEAYYDPHHALQQAFRQMDALRPRGPQGTHLNWLCRYNKRDGNVAPAVRARYQAGLNWADAYLQEHIAVSEHEFTGGFAAYVEELSRAGYYAGEPLTGEEQWGSATVQVTTTGLLIYVSPGQPLFLVGAGTQG